MNWKERYRKEFIEYALKLKIVWILVAGIGAWSIYWFVWIFPTGNFITDTLPRYLSIVIFLWFMYFLYVKGLFIDYWNAKISEEIKEFLSHFKNKEYSFRFEDPQKIIIENDEEILELEINQYWYAHKTKGGEQR